MAKLVIDGAVQVRLHWYSGTTVFYNVLGATVAGGLVVNQTLANSLGAAIKTGFASSGYGARVHVGAALNAVGVRDIRVADMPEFIDTGSVAPGTGAGDPLPRQTALVYTLRTARAGANFRGRIYLGGWTESDNDTNGTVAGAATTAASAFLTSIDAAFDANGLTMAVLSRPRNAQVIPEKVIAAKSGFATPVTSMQLRNALWDTQRRRAAPGAGSSLFRVISSVPTRFSEET